VVAAIGAVNLFVSAATTFFIFRARRASPPPNFFYSGRSRKVLRTALVHRVFPDCYRLPPTGGPDFCRAASMAPAWLAGLDDEVEQYVVGILADTDDGDDDVLDDLVELLAAHGVEDTGSALRGELLALREQQPLPAEREPAPIGESSSACRTAASEPTTPLAPQQPQPPAALTPAEAMLCEMVPCASRELCCFALRQAKGDTEAALDRLLCGDVAALEAELAVAARAAERAAQAERKQDRRRVLGRYGEERDYAADGVAPKLAPPRLPYNESRKVISCLKHSPDNGISPRLVRRIKSLEMSLSLSKSLNARARIPPLSEMVLEKLDNRNIHIELGVARTLILGFVSSAYPHTTLHVEYAGREKHMIFYSNLACSMNIGP